MSPDHRRGFGSVRKLDTGRYQARYTGPNGKRYAAGTFGQARQAERALERVRVRIDDGLWTPPDATPDELPTFAQVAEDWLTKRPKPLKPRTRAHYRRLLDVHVLPTLGALPVDGITADTIEAWYYSLNADTPTMRAHVYSLTRSILSRAVKRYGLPGNPCDIEGASGTKRRIRPVVLTTDEIDALVAAMPERLRAMVLLATWCALRFGELAALRRADVDLDVGLVTVSRGVVRVGGQVITDTPKTEAGARVVTIPPHIVPALREHLERHTGRRQGSLLFPAATPAPDGSERPLNPSTLYRSYYPAREKIGQPSLRWHDLRHTGLTHAGRFATTAELMARAGHTTAEAAMIYQHAARGRDAEIAADLSELVTGKGKDPEQEAREAADLAAYLAGVVEDAPPLSDEQKARLRAMLGDTTRR